ncbi:hypothetical protein [Mycobacterium leprae]|uniref:hypothetical protein n=1 Tax=Mycobacterium leprae TaxID=1769 RepID=UPI0012E7E1DB|nr:hypothetical protein [Mycobacterium leprae]
MEAATAVLLGEQRSSHSATSCHSSAWIRNALALARLIMIAMDPGLVSRVWLNVLHVLRQFPVGMRSPGASLVFSVVVVAANVELDIAFIRGVTSFPKIGLVGIVLATTLVQVFTVGVYYTLLPRDDQLASLLAVDGWNAHIATARKILLLGSLSR